MSVQLRVARPVSDLGRSVRLYTAGLGLQQLGGFIDHDGFDGVMVGDPQAMVHFEFTCCRHHPVAPSPTPEDLLVFYVPDDAQWEARCAAMRDAGFAEAAPFNPYWARTGRTFRDHDGYSVVIQHGAWRASPEPAHPAPA